MLKWSPLQKAQTATGQFVKVSFSLFIRNIIFQLEEGKGKQGCWDLQSSGRVCAIAKCHLTVCLKGPCQPAAGKGARGQKHSGCFAPAPTLILNVF